MSLIEQPSIYIGNILISEPITSLTDFIVTITCIFCFFSLQKLNKEKQVKAISFMQYYLLFIGLSTFLAGLLGHSFNHILGFEWKVPGWIASILALGLLERAAIEHAHALIPEKIYQRLCRFNLLQMAVFSMIAVGTLNFFAVVVQTAYVLLGVVLILHIYTYQRTGDRGSLFMLISIGVTAFSAITFIAQISISKWFNHADLSHVIIAISAYCYYLGAKRMLSQRHLKLLYAIS